jgi:aspartyl aminopeptidase
MDKETKSAGQKLEDDLCFSPKNCWEDVKPKYIKEVDEFSETYRHFLNNCKTERECVSFTVQLLKKRGFIDIETLGNKEFKKGMKLFQNIKGKSLLVAVMGQKSLAEGCNILGAHIDSPRIDLKQNPLYEESELAFFDTHYYGGIKKYQWTAIPLAMHGVFIRDDGKKIEFKIGEDVNDPVFTITDLLPHLAREQMEKKASEVIEGEDLDILVGSRPYNDKKVKEKVKLKILSLLNEKYGITESNFASAEIEFVPAFQARDLGFDRSMIGAYGHDDRCCVWPVLMAALSFENAPHKTVICYMSDKEEIGSEGNTGAKSINFYQFIATLCEKNKANVRHCLSHSMMLSTDVSAAFDPSYAVVFDKKNTSFLGKGIVLTKYTGSGGKRGASDANAEFCAKVQAIMNRNKINWQFGELGKVDKGGGGTIALYAANLGIEVLDCGIAVLSMHSPFEVISKIDLYTAYRGYMAFLREA